MYIAALFVIAQYQKQPETINGGMDTYTYSLTDLCVHFKNISSIY